MTQACDDTHVKISESTVLSVALCTRSDGTLKDLFLGTEAGLYRSCQGADDPCLTTPLVEGIGIHALALSPQFSLDGMVLAGGESEHILRSDDGGETWAVHTLESPGAMVTALALSPQVAQDGVALAGTARDGILRSTDHGRTWKRASFGLLSLTIYALATAPTWTTDEECALAVTEAGLYRSTNGGRAWRLVEGEMERQPGLAAAFSPEFQRDGRVVVGTEGAGVWQSLDWGLSWHQAGLDNLVVNGLAFCALPVGGSVLLAGTSEAGLWRLEAGRESWESVDVPMPPVLSLSASGPWIVAGVHGRGVYLSANHGQDWRWLGGQHAI
jgi:photosystem II stability/assembly factor-like uncharacterized protein